MMGMFVIPTSTVEAHYSQRTALDGRDYIFDIDYNQRADSWSFNLRDAEGALIVAGVRIVLGMPLLRLVRDERRPPGEIAALDLSGERRDPGFGELGDRVLLVYYDAAELEALAP